MPSTILLPRRPDGCTPPGPLDAPSAPAPPRHPGRNSPMASIALRLRFWFTRPYSRAEEGRSRGVEKIQREPEVSPLGEGGAFTTTHWSVVLTAARNTGDTSAAALNDLCQAYWPPIYAFIRREGHPPSDAQDLTQEFLARLVHKGWLTRVDSRLGRFRSFLLSYLKSFLSDQRDRSQALKRGGGKTFVSADAFEEEERAGLLVDPISPDQLYDRRWARVIMDRAHARLRDSYARRGKLAWYEQLKDVQGRESGGSGYAGAAEALGTTEQAVKNAVLRLRERYGQLLREEIANTVSSPDEFTDELRHFLEMVG